MADETFSIGCAVATQATLGTFDSTLETDSEFGGTITAAEGAVLGDRESGDAESGITIPTFTRLVRENADVAASFTRQVSSFERNQATGFTIAWQAKGNGATVSGTPADGEAKPDAGIDALIEGAGLIGANGTAPTYEYAPRTNASSGGSTRYISVALWIGTHLWKFRDCVVEQLQLSNVAGEGGLWTANVRIGDVYEFGDDVTFPSFTFNNQASLSSPRVVSAPATYSTAKGFGSFTLSVNNAIEEVPDSNTANGFRLDQTSRTFDIESQLFLDTADSDLEYQELIRTTGTPANWSHQVGTAAGGSDVANAYKVEARRIEVEEVKYDRAATATVANLKGHATHTSAGSEFTLTLN